MTNSYGDFLPKSGAGVTEIGSIVKMMSTLDPLLEIGGETYLKEGYTLADAQSQYPEAFARLSGRDGKQWEWLRPTADPFSGRCWGLFNAANAILAFLGDQTRVQIYLINPELRSLRKVGEIPNGETIRSPFVECGGLFVASVDNNKFVVVNPADFASPKVVASPIGNWGYSHFIKGVPTKGGILWFGSQRAFVGYMKMSGASIASLDHYDLGFADTLASCISFKEVGGQEVTMFGTSGGKILWKAGVDHSNEEGWIVKWDQVTDYPMMSTSFNWAMYSAEADVVYFASGAGGFYVAANPRMTPVEPGGLNGIPGLFELPFDGSLGWSMCDGFLFAQPHDTNKVLNQFYRFNPDTREWDTLKHASDYRFATINTTYSNGTYAARFAGHMVTVGTGQAGGTYLGLMVSSDTVYLPSDPSTKGGVANFVRIK